jgi:plastocyanin
MSLQFPSIARCRRVSRRSARGCVAAVLALLVLGCAEDAAVAPSPRIDDPNMYWALTLDHRGVTLSTVPPYDTIRLTATPRTMDGAPIADMPAPTFTSLDLDRAIVSADGLVRALKTGTRIPIVATLTIGNLRHADTAFLNVTSTATPPVLATLSIHPDSADSAKVSRNSLRLIIAKARTADDSSITGLSVYYASLDPTVATMDRATGRLSPLRPGRVKVVASATAYGVMKTDTVLYTIGYPVSLFIYVTPQTTPDGRTINGFVPSHVELGPGAIVRFFNTTGVATDVTFDDPTNIASVATYCGAPFTTTAPWLCASGNIDAFGDDGASGFATWRVRAFPVPGTYTFHSTLFGTTGTIVVVNEPDDIP